MKYKSLRFFIDLSSLIGWVIIIVGCLASVFVAIPMMEKTNSGMPFFTILIPGILISMFFGLQIFAMGNLFQCFIDIEENTGSTVKFLEALKSRNEKRVYQDVPVQEVGNSGFTYMCSGCQTFQRSDVLKCLKCGTDNPHHPSYRSGGASADPLSASQLATGIHRCSRCGAGMNPDDQFCSSCGRGTKNDG